MIKTTELMLGNLVEYRNTYVQVINLAYGDLMIRHNGIGVHIVESDINPIPLTEVVLKRLDLAIVDEDSVHQLQNYPTVRGLNPIDITPLLSPRYTTHDNVEVWEGDKVWFCYISGTRSKNEVDTPNSTVAHEGIPTNKNYYYFSTKQACQSYIDSVTRKPIFTTEDGVDVHEGDEYYYTNKSGYYGCHKSKIMTYDSAFMCCGKDSNYVYFSTKELAQKYLNRTWLKADAEKAEKEYQDLLKPKTGGHYGC